MKLKLIGENTTLHSIIQKVEDDFEITISEETAQEIKTAHVHGALLWSGNKIIATDASRIRIVKREDGVIESSVDYKLYPER